LKTSTKLGAGASLTFLLSSFLTTGVAANAETVEGCGETPMGATLEKTDEYCQLIFGFGPGASLRSEWIVPQGVTSLQALLVGGGAGANRGFAVLSGEGYSGDGGKVSYADLTSTEAGTEFTVIVGAGGVSDMAGTGSSVAGGLTEILGPGSSEALVSALGGENAGSSGFCVPEELDPEVANRVVLAFGVGSAAAVDDDNTCDEFGSKGIVPGEDTNSLSLFKDMTAEALGNGGFGNGGIVSMEEPQVFTPGMGAWVKVSAAGEVTGATSGFSGLVIFRYILEQAPVEKEEELADTGASEEQLATLAKAAALIAGLGALMLIPARRRRNRA
jgi:hypothetical protein